MIQVRINQGRVEVQDTIPPAWEGQFVKLVPLTPEDPLPDLAQRIAALHEMGPMEFEPGEREAMASAWEEMDRLGKEGMHRLSNSQS